MKHPVYVVWERLAKSGMEVGNMKFNTQHEELMSVCMHNFVRLSVQHAQ